MGARPIRWLSLVGVLSLCFVHPIWAAKCLFISSYHRGYAWSDGVEQGVRAVLKSRCDLRQFDLDAKRHKEPQEIAQKALEARALIESWQPDVVITADDDAAKYVLMPFYKDHTIPFVFCGINWTVEEYGFPYRNATGMVEVAPVEALFEKAETLLSKPQRAFYVGANTSSEHKNLQQIQLVTRQRGIAVDHQLADTTAAWLAAFQMAQEAYDFVILGSNAGINDWQHEKIYSVITSAWRLTLTNHEWMMPYAMLGFTKIPIEQGEWAAQTALYILAGVAPDRIPIVPNRKWEIWVNMSLAQTAGIHLPRALVQKAKKVQ
jgi:ABC-type uncharacterized transport system substrate-binding protein